jgi:hypothetical protein
MPRDLSLAKRISSGFFCCRSLLIPCPFELSSKSRWSIEAPPSSQQLLGRYSLGSPHYRLLQGRLAIRKQVHGALCAAHRYVELRVVGLARRCYVMVRSGTDIIKIAWVYISDRCFYAGVSPNPSDYLEPMY